jgi:predicted dehydrogenase
MRCLLRGTWTDGVLDAWRGPGDYRIQVEAFANLDPLEDLYFVRSFQPRVVWNYLRQVGPVMVWRKVASRLQERSRNEKWVSAGVGTVLEAPAAAAFPPGCRVAFLAPTHPACLERLVVPPGLVASWEGGSLPLREGFVLHEAWLGPEELGRPWWEPVQGWSPAAGQPISPGFTRGLGKAIAEELLGRDWSRAQALPAGPDPTVAETSESSRPAHHGAKKRAVLFGYGHYAKTIIRPNVSEYLEIEAAHEVDPTQVPMDGGQIARWDTAPEGRDAEHYDVSLIAGYHHTHAPLAVWALQRGGYAVSEKPVAVDSEQLEALLCAVAKSERGFFGCFHKRYSPLNRLALQDLGQRPGAPIDYHCVVYEVPLPDLHWYLWPNSKSRLVSNGCHWIDHFLYLNGFCEVRQSELFAGPRGTINCSVVLRNGAVFTMVLTDQGSDRIGLQDHVELRAGSVTVTISNNTDYLAENRVQILRRVRINKMRTYKAMYREIARRIARDEGGDTADSIRVSTALILDLEAKLQAQLAAAADEDLPALGAPLSIAGASR